MTTGLRHSACCFLRYSVTILSRDISYSVCGFWVVFLNAGLIKPISFSLINVLFGCGCCVTEKKIFWIILTEKCCTQYKKQSKSKGTDKEGIFRKFVLPFVCCSFFFHQNIILYCISKVFQKYPQDMFWCQTVINWHKKAKHYLNLGPAEPRYALPLQCRSEEANWSGSARFIINYVNLYQQPGSSNLIGWKLEVAVAL